MEHGEGGWTRVTAANMYIYLFITNGHLAILSLSSP